MEKKYWSDIDNIVLGNYNQVGGYENLVYGNNHNVRGNSNYIINDKPHVIKTPLVDENVVRIGRFEIDLERLHLIKRDPSLCITRLETVKSQYRKYGR